MKIYKLEGYDDCIAGIAEGAGLTEPVICYDADKLLARFESEGMTREEAIERLQRLNTWTIVGEHNVLTEDEFEAAVKPI